LPRDRCWGSTLAQSVLQPYSNVTFLVILLVLILIVLILISKDGTWSTL